MSDDISVIGHMSGQGEALADKLRRAGYTTIQKIIEEEPSVLSESAGLEPSTVSNVLSSAKSLGGMHPAGKTKAKKKPAAQPRDTIADKISLDPLRQVAHKVATEHEIVEAIALKLIGDVIKSPVIREQILKAVMDRPLFRQTLANHLAKKLS